MLKRICSFGAALLLFCTSAFAQSGEYISYTPYSVFGIGDLFSGSSSAYNAGMGGVGIASRNNRYLNTLNPAAVASRDTLALMVDFALFNKNTVYSQNYGGQNLRSANNSTNIAGLAISFPIWDELAGAAGLKPYSSVGYSFESAYTDPDNGVVNYSLTGLGSLYNIYGVLSYNILKNLSVGVEADYIFGKINKNAEQNFIASGYSEARSSKILTLGAFTGKFGLQYEQPLGKDFRLGFGVAYTLGTSLRGFNEGKFYSTGGKQNVLLPSSYADTLGSGSGVRLAGELALGVSFAYSDNFRAEFDYSRSDWRKSGMDAVRGFAVNDAAQTFRTSVKESFRAGVEYIPNPNDVRYYRKRVAYRAGAYYNSEYYTVAGAPVKTLGVSLGMTLPVFRWYNGISITVDAGQRGPFDGSLVRERFLRFTVGVNLFDIWFQKPKYN